ncbi:MAG: carboxypeptidase regulatory-like domain-containing protein, partial [Fibrobacterota bacterium]
TVVVRAEGYEAEIVNTLRFTRKEEKERDFRLYKNRPGDDDYGTIRGRVTTESGDPAGNVAVAARDHDLSTRTDSAGYFAFDSLESGVYHLVSGMEGYDTTTVFDIDLWAGQSVTADIVLEKIDESRVLTGNNGALEGVVVDATTGEPMEGVIVDFLRRNSSVGSAKTDGQGRFYFQTDPGDVTVEVSRSGYEDQQVSAAISEAAVQERDFIMEKSGYSSMQRMTIRSVAVKSSSAALLKDRQKSLDVVDAVAAEQLSKSGASDAADAMKAVTGVTVVDGKYVIVRGLPAKYSVAKLNGAVLPSSDPDEQAVHMDMFPSSVIENISVSKTARADIPANFSGGVVDITTKPFPEEETFTAKLGTSLKPGASFNSDFLTYDGGKTDFLGIDDGTRKQPAILDEYTKQEISEMKSIYNSFPYNWAPDISAEKMAQFQALTDMTRSLSDDFEPQKKTALPEISGALSYGNTLKRGNEPFLGYNLSLSYKNSRSFEDDIKKRNYSFSRFIPETQDSVTAAGDTVQASVPDSLQGYPDPVKERDFSVVNAKEKVLWNIMLNGALHLSENSTIKGDYLFLKNSSDNVTNAQGFFKYYDDNDGVDIYRLHYIERTMNYLRLEGEHSFYPSYNPWVVSWNSSLVKAIQDEPDMRNTSHFYNVDSTGDTTYNYEANFGDPSHKWRKVTRRQFSQDIDLSIPFYQWNDDSSVFRTGVSWQRLSNEQRTKKMTYNMQSYLSDLKADSLLSSFDYLRRSKMGLLEDSTMKSGYFTGLIASESSEDIQQRAGYSDILSAYFMVELPVLGEYLKATSGLRYEGAYLYDETVVEEKQTDSSAATLNDNDFLPSVLLTSRVSDNFVVKAGYGQTLYRPSIREKADYKTEAFTNGPSFQGNPDLQRSLVDNFDCRFEYYPQAGELFAVGTYYKAIYNAIENEFLLDGTRRPINTTTARLFGVELEAVKNLTSRWSANANMSFTWSQVRLNDDMQKLETYFPAAEDERPFQGQSPFVGNLLIAYDNDEMGFKGSLYYNVFGKRLAAVTDQDVPFLWEKPFHTLNLVTSKELGAVNLSFKVKNIFNQAKVYYFDYDGADLITDKSRKGTSFSLSAGFDIK